MPKLTNIEETLLDGLHDQAMSLQNGKRGDMETMSEVIGKMARVVVAMAKMGGVSSTECRENQQHLINETRQLNGSSDWKAKLAIVIPICGTVGAIAFGVLKVLGKT